MNRIGGGLGGGGVGRENSGLLPKRELLNSLLKLPDRFPSLALGPDEEDENLFPKGDADGLLLPLLKDDECLFIAPSFLLPKGEGLLELELFLNVDDLLPLKEGLCW